MPGITWLGEKLSDSQYGLWYAELANAIGLETWLLSLCTADKPTRIQRRPPMWSFKSCGYVCHPVSSTEMRVGLALTSHVSVRNAMNRKACNHCNKTTSTAIVTSDNTRPPASPYSQFSEKADSQKGPWFFSSPTPSTAYLELFYGVSRCYRISKIKPTYLIWPKHSNRSPANILRLQRNIFKVRDVYVTYILNII
jgi:hypothetical protein